MSTATEKRQRGVAVKRVVEMKQLFRKSARAQHHIGLVWQPGLVWYHVGGGERRATSDERRATAAESSVRYGVMAADGLSSLIGTPKTLIIANPFVRLGVWSLGSKVTLLYVLI